MMLMKGVGRVLVSVAMLVGLVGCIGGKVPSEQILRIAQPETATEMVAEAGQPIVILKNLEAFPALERSAVMLANGNVLTPSSRWYWEGSPAAIATASLAAALQERSGFTTVWPARNRLQHSGQLDGNVDAFEVHMVNDPFVRIRLRLALWTERGRTLIATKTVTSDVTMPDLTAGSIADAASKAMQNVTKDAADWMALTGLRALPNE